MKITQRRCSESVFLSPPHLHPFPSIPTPRLIPPSALPPFTSSSLSHPSHITHHYRIPSFWIHHPSSLNHRFTTPYMSHRPPHPNASSRSPPSHRTPHPSSNPSFSSPIVQQSHLHHRSIISHISLSYHSALLPPATSFIRPTFLPSSLLPLTFQDHNTGVQVRPHVVPGGSPSNPRSAPSSSMVAPLSSMDTLSSSNDAPH